MTTQQVANRLIELCRKGQIQQAQEELYGETMVSIEPKGAPIEKAEGLKAVSEKGKKQLSGYTPIVTVTTRREAGKVKIAIRDNGLGISEKYIGKIYQPFFTTKPTGVGTGLGLSLSYEIIKAHEGELMVESVEGEFAEFTIELPVN